MSRDEIMQLYNAHKRRDALVPGMRAQLLPEVTRYADSTGLEGLIMWHSFHEADAARIVAREMDCFANTVKAFTWKVYEGDQPAQLTKLLEHSGLHAARVDALMIGEAAKVAELPQRSTATIRILKKPRELNDLYSVWEAVWPGVNDGWVAVLSEVIETMPELRILVASEDGKPVATGFTVIDPRGMFAYLGGGATLASHRGRGIYRALVIERARLARERGTRFLAVEASPHSAPILARLGFEKLTELQFFERRA